MWTEKLRLKNEIASLKSLNDKLKIKNKKLSLFIRKSKRVNKILERKHETLKANIAKIFTPAQIKRLETNKKSKFDDEDIAKCIALFSVGKRAYIYALKQLKYPLPAVSTLRRRVAHIKITPGFMNVALKLLSAITCIDELNSLFVLSFDETNIKNEYAYSVTEDKVYPPCKNAFVIMVKNLITGLKTPIYHNFDKKPTKELIFEAIRRLRRFGGIVVVLVCDQSPSNRSFFRDIGITTKKTFFSHPDHPDEKIFCFYDFPHALKNIRGHLLDHGLKLTSGHVINKALFRKLLLADSGEMKMCPKLSKDHVEVCIRIYMY